MHHPISTDEAERTTRSLRQPSRPTSSDDPEPGDRFLGPSGRIWTVEAITTRGNRIVLSTPTPDGDSGAIVDRLAIARMIPLPFASSPDDVPATLGDRRTRWGHGDATDDDRRSQAILQTADGVAHDANTNHGVTRWVTNIAGTPAAFWASVDTTTSSSVDVSSIESEEVEEANSDTAQRPSGSTPGDQ